MQKEDHRPELKDHGKVLQNLCQSWPSSFSWNYEYKILLNFTFTSSDIFCDVACTIKQNKWKLQNIFHVSNVSNTVCEIPQDNIPQGKGWTRSFHKVNETTTKRGGEIEEVFSGLNLYLQMKPGLIHYMKESA